MKKTSLTIAILITYSVLILLFSVHSAVAMLVIDAGHGGKDPGAIGVNGVYEKDLNLTVATLVAAELHQLGYQVAMTRESDVFVSLEGRANFSNNLNANLFISIHHNSFTSNAPNGTEVFYYYGSYFGQKLAKRIVDRISTDMGLVNRGAKEAGFYVLRNTEAVAVLVECGFLSNPIEAAKLADPEFQSRMARSIASAVHEFILHDFSLNLITRLFGADRYGTAISLSSQNFVSAENVVIATGENFPDALAGAPLAHALSAPILLVPSNYLPDSVAAEIQRLGASRAFILGGEKAVSPAVINSLRTRGLILYDERIGGADRYETSYMIYEKIKEITGTTPTTITVATGENFPDALAASGVCARLFMPIVLVRKNEIPPSIQKVIQETSSTVVLGGEAAVSTTVLSLLPSPIRLAGEDRYGTAKAVADFALMNGFSPSSVMVCTGENFPDALAAGAISALKCSPVLLTAKSSFSEPAKDFVRANRGSLKNVIIVGGEQALPRKITDQIKITYLTNF